ncbi:MAG TPA: methyltransferase domain-containing protein [Jatrophihabitans sp.]|nr:methyltransferase domain-containing protein [Jatrophihabitans sp.]
MHDHDDDHLDDLLDLDGEVLAGYWTEAIEWTVQRTGGHPCKKILDLGAGTGVGTIRLAGLFPDAEVTAVDLAEASLARLRATADGLRLAGRIRTVVADLDAGWPVPEPVDLTWASMSLHHLADPDRLLSTVHAATAPGGLIALAEFAEPLRFLPDGFAGDLEARCLAALRHRHTAELPHLGADWAPHLAAAGFTTPQERRFDIAVNAIGNPAALRYARLWLARLAHGLNDHAPAADRQALAGLVRGDGLDTLQRRGELVIRGTRTVTVARR